MFNSIILIALFAFCFPLLADETKTRVFPVEVSDQYLDFNDSSNRLRWMVAPQIKEEKIEQLFESIVKKNGLELTKAQARTSVLIDVLSTARCVISPAKHDELIVDLMTVIDEHFPNLKSDIDRGFDNSETLLSPLTYVQTSINKDACYEEELTRNTAFDALNMSADEHQNYLEDYNRKMLLLGYYEASKEEFIDLNSIDLNEGSQYLTDFDSAIEAGILLDSPIRLQGLGLEEIGYERIGTQSKDGFTSLSGLYLSEGYGVIRFTQEDISSQETVYFGDVMNYDFLGNEAILYVQREKETDNYFSEIRWLHPENNSIEYTFSLNENLNDSDSNKLHTYLEQLYSDSSKANSMK